MRFGLLQNRLVLVTLFTGLVAMGSTKECYAYNPKEGNVTASFGPFYSKTNLENRGSEYNPFRIGFGVVAVGDVNNRGALEVGIFNMRKMFFVQRDGFLNVHKIEVVHVTMGYRFFVNSFLSTSLSFASAYTIGKPAVLFNDFPPGSELKTSAEDLTEYGFDFAVQAELWRREKMAIYIDTRYSRSVTSKEDESGDHYGIMIGASYLVQGSQGR